MKPHIIYDLIRFGNNAYISRGSFARLIKRQIAKQNPFDSQLKIGEDLVWNLELLNQCQSIVIAHRIWYIYYYNGESVTHKFNRNIIEPLELELNKINQLIDWNTKTQVEAYYSHIFDMSQPISIELPQKTYLIGLIILLTKDFFNEFIPSLSLINSSYLCIRWSSYIVILVMIMLFGVFGADHFIYVSF